MVRRARPRNTQQDVVCQHESASDVLELVPSISHTSLPAPALPPRQLRAVDLLLCGHGVQETADQLGVARQRIWAWRQRPEFQREVARRRDDLLSELCSSMVAGTREAVEVVRECMGYETPTGSARDEKQRLRAAAAMLGLAAKGNALSRLLAARED